jgi:hypothetical protein
VKRTRLLGSLGLLVGLALLAGGCTRPPRPITSDPDFTGVITKIEPGTSTGTLGKALVESLGGMTVDKYSVTVKADTRIFEKEGESYRLTVFASATVGDQVQLWFTGPILESYPAQATARQVVIVESGVIPQFTAAPPPSSPSSVPATPSVAPTSPALTSTPSPQAPAPTTTETYLGVMRQGGRLGGVWNLADVRYGVHPDRLRVVVEMVEPRDHVPLYKVVEVDNAAEPFPAGHDPSWGTARIDLVVSDLYAYDSPAFEALPIAPVDNPTVTRFGHYPTFDDSSLGLSIGLKVVSAYEVHELTDPVRIVIDVLW